MKRRLFGIALLLVLAGAVWTSVWRLKRDETGLVLRFGRVVRTAPPGATFTLPWPFEELVRVSTTEVRSLEIGFPSQERSQFWPVADVEAQWLTGDTNIVEMKFLVRYTIEDPAAYLLHVDDAEAVLARVSQAVVTEITAGLPIEHLLSAGKAELQRRAKEEIQVLVAELGLGLRLASVDIAASAPPAQVIAAFNDVTSAANDRERAVQEADGFRRDLLPTERARANRVLNEARQDETQRIDESQGETRAFTSLAEKLADAGPEARRRIWLEGVTKILGRGRLVVWPADSDEPFRHRIIE